MFVHGFVALFLCAFTFLLKVHSTGCFDLGAEMDNCAQIHRIPRLSDKRHGYDFGYGSLNDTEFMCRTKYHIKIIKCVKERWEATCDTSAEPDFLKVVWAHTLNTKRYERAAAYICRQHNLRIFHQHKDACLREAEPAAEGCSRQTDESIQEVVGALKNQSVNAALGLIGDTYQQHLKKIMLVYECKAMRRKLDCLYALLSSQCPVNAVQLIMNYFIESLPTGCHYLYRSAGKEDTEAMTMAIANPSAMQGDDGTPPRLSPILPLHLNEALQSPSDLPPNHCSCGVGADVVIIFTILIIPWFLVLIG
ncbi:unnamed protein product [Hydatigera taeniaeformis]|uniref:Uncharacterized protein n=1 Tax=Hydatigena taeniaeformis TaxID=6205 RepID=A0A0R3WL63_HYDTA|nr:unnamed protein product [Hydatigera taeniaeformis]